MVWFGPFIQAESSSVFIFIFFLFFFWDELGSSGIVWTRTFSSKLAQEMISSFSRPRILFTSVRKVIWLSSVSRVMKMAEVAWRRGGRWTEPGPCRRERANESNRMQHMREGGGGGGSREITDGEESHGAQPRKC